MLCRLFDNRKYMDIYLPIHHEYCYLGKQKICFCIFPYQLVNTGGLHLQTVQNVRTMNPSKDAADWSVVDDFKS